jgi:hypothetical protein
MVVTIIRTRGGDSLFGLLEHKGSSETVTSLFAGELC